MARTLTLTALRERVRQRYDLPTFASTTWASDTAIDVEINSSLQSFYALLLDCSGDEYFGTTSDLTTTANIDLTSLPSRCLRVHSLVWLRDTDDPVILEPAGARDARLSGLEPRTWDTYRPRYQLHGTTSIRWLPTPAAAYTVRCTYSALPADLTSSDTFEAGPAWDDWVVADVCSKLCEREERDASAFIARRTDAEARVRTQAPIRTDGNNNLFLDRRNNLENLSAYELRDLATRLF